ncbi:alpha/beta hydrolase domain-containing protein [Anatilimnocola floriformis]|uniref:alpha/beta hydrolase domain-containing protein n=1 Tax=Anatilimnocola floriformis TaxID=2948575 RepID=UPI0020C4A661|nr:alpha/beta hydrolase domain-containing protein [Anatilimnocola floriformis]
MRRFCLLILVVVAACASAARAEVVRWEIAHREPYQNGKSFGERGLYERLRGKVHFAIDPKNEHNQQIIDLALAPQNDKKRVEFSADFEMLVPNDRSQANGALFYEVNNRGGSTAKNLIDGGAEDFLCRQGFVILWSGWIAEVQPGAGRWRLQTPFATEDGKPLRGLVRSEFILDKPAARASIAHRGNTGSFKPAEDLTRNAILSFREKEAEPRKVVPRGDWKFIVTNVTGEGVTGGMETGQLPTVEIELTGGLQPGLIYEVVYEAEDAPVQGCGMAGIRDIVSALKFGETTATNPLVDDEKKSLINRAHGFGTSQSGRLLRQFLWEGFNTDEQGRQVFDGVIAHVAGGGLGSFNHRFASPTRTNSQHDEHLFPADYFPFAYGDQQDPHTGQIDGILRKCREMKSVPKVFHAQSSSEYWHRSGSLVHTDPLGKTDAEIPAEVRLYTFGGSNHGPGGGTPGAKSNGQLPSSPADYRPLLRALVVALDAWVKDNVAPPPSVYPLLSEKSLVGWQAEQSGWPKIPGVSYPQLIQQPANLYRGPWWESKRIATLEPPEVRESYGVRVPAMTVSGNERGTLNVPAVAVPVGTYTSWNTRDASIGAAGELWSLQGGFIPFCKTAEERETAKDPRPALAQLYTSYEDYETKYLAAADNLVKQRYLLEEDLPRLKTLCEKFKPWFKSDK